MKLNEIETRIAEINAMDENEMNLEEVKAINEEYDKLIEEKRQIIEEAEKRKKVVDDVTKIENPTIIKNFKEEKKMEFTAENVFKTPEYRSAWAKSLMGLPLTEIEEKAAGVALTTTATTYVGADGSNDGVNNAGLFIPEDVMMDLMSRIELVSPFFRDIPKTAVNGYVKFPYRVGGTGAKKQTEGVANTDGQVQWGELTLTVLEVSETIRVTWKLEAMSVDGFIKYIVEELAAAIPEKIMAEIFYGNASGTLTGVTHTEMFIDGAYTVGSSTGNVVDLFEAVSEGLKLMTDKRKRVGMKIYVSPEVYDDMIFTRDGEIRFLHNPINGVGIQTIGRYPVEVDPFLEAGDFIIGNPRYYKFNWNETLSLTKDVSGKNRINDYTGYAIVSGAPQPGCFVYGKKSS